MKRWLVKVLRYGGGTSVLAHYDDAGDAAEDAAQRNIDYQTRAHYVEENWNYVEES